MLGALRVTRSSGLVFHPQRRATTRRQAMGGALYPVATVLLAAKYPPLWQVVAGTTLGMLLANVPVVALGSRFAQRLPLRAARMAAALAFLALGSWALLRGIG